MNRFNKLLILSTLVILACIVFYYNSKNINIREAWVGFSPNLYVNQKLHPENYSNNFMKTLIVDLYDNSQVMKSYYYTKKYLNINPEIFIYIFMLFQTFFFVFSLAFLIHTLFEDWVIILLGCVSIFLSITAGANLSRYTSDEGFNLFLSLPLFYTYATSCTFVAIAFSLRAKYFLMFIFLVLTLFCHMTMGLIACLFVGFYFTTHPKIIIRKDFLVGLTVFFLLIASQIIPLLKGGDISAGVIPVNNWIKSTQMFCSHWYPFIMKEFTTRAHYEFFPVVITLILFLILLKEVDIRSEKTHKIIFGVIACVVFSIIGIILVQLEIPFFIKLSLQRSSGLISFFGVLFLVNYLVRKIQNRNLFVATIAACYISIIMCFRTGIAFLPLIILIYDDLKAYRIGPFAFSDKKKRILFICYYLFLILLLSIVLIDTFNLSIKKELWTPLQFFGTSDSFFITWRLPLTLSTYLNSYFAILLAVLLLIFFKCFKQNSKYLNPVVLFIVNSFLIVVAAVNYYSNNSLKDGLFPVQKAYYNAQLWAKNNTSNDTLFIQDPTHHYAWPDYSNRSSFGTFRDWGYCCIAYVVDAQLYYEGKKRMKEFGVDLDTITQDDIKNYESFPYEVKFRYQIKKIYYSMSPVRFYNLSKKYGIDYIIIKKDDISTKNNNKLSKAFQIAYENDYYLIYKIDNYKYHIFEEASEKAYRELQKELASLKNNFKNIDNLNKLVTANPGIIDLLTVTEKTKLVQLTEFDRKKSNIVINPGAEEGNEKPIGWKTKKQLLNESTGWASDVVHTGIRSLKINNNGKANTYWVGEKIKINKPVKSFKLSAWAYIDAKNKFTPKIGQIYFFVNCQLKNTNKTINKVVNFDIDKRNQWQHKTIDVEFDKDVEEITPYVCANSNVGTVWFDDIEIFPLKEIYSLL